MDVPNPSETIGLQIVSSVRRLQSQQDPDPYSPTKGCLDRRYWAWKLVDYPEATFQRNVQPLAELWADPQSQYYQNTQLMKAVLTGLDYATTIQHDDGSFDQAFPQERSFGATGLLLYSLLKAHILVRKHMDSELKHRVENCLILASDFLCRRGERHGLISNHIAGAALALYICGDYFGQSRFTKRADELLRDIVSSQSEEGWFPEYEGADPGYQTLCLYYLVQIYRIMPTDVLKGALDRAVKFIAHFLHPDGSFGGEYGSRRTALFYPGGLASLSKEFPMARSIIQAMCRSICKEHTITLYDVDMGNLAPLLSNYVCLLQSNVVDEQEQVPLLPWEQSSVRQDFSEAGLYVRGTGSYYAILGVSNGGVLKVFDKQEQRVLWDDGGYVGKLGNGTLVTTQMTIPDRPCTVRDNDIVLVSKFYRVLHTLPTPLRFMLLRLLNLTLMRNVKLGNWAKRKLVRMLISGRREYELELQRKVSFEPVQVIVEDRISKSSKLEVRWLEFGRKFVGIHMASARYSQYRSANQVLSVPQIDTEELNQQQHLAVRVVIEGSHA
jgi:hypothetical protein